MIRLYIPTGVERRSIEPDAFNSLHFSEVEGSNPFWLVLSSWDEIPPEASKKSPSGRVGTIHSIFTSKEFYRLFLAPNLQGATWKTNNSGL
jgi:hypothetical protein